MKAVGKIIGAALVAAGVGAALAGPALAETELSFYTGFQAAPHSRVEGNDPGGVGDFSFLSTWEGRPFEMPPYYGFRATYWLQRNPNLGFGLDFSHNKVYADDETLATNGFDRLEFTDGLNTITANVWYRWPGQWMNGRLTPYVGAGAGLAIPHVDVETAGGKTFATTGNHFADGQVIETTTELKKGTESSRRRAVWQYRLAREHRDRRNHTLQVQRAEDIAAGRKAQRKARFLTTGQRKSLTVDYEAAKAAEQLFGLKG